MSTLTRLLDTALFEALGWTLLHSLWQAAAVALLLSLILIWGRQLSARIRYIMAISAIGVILLAAIATFAAQYHPSKMLAMATPLSSNMPLVETDQLQAEVRHAVPGYTSIGSQSFEFRRYIEPYIPPLAGLWLVGLLLLGLRLVGEAAYLQHLRHYGCRALPKKWHDKLGQIAAVIQLRQPVSIKETNRVSSPMVIGIFKPLILLPAGMAAGIDPGQLESILAHELAHIKRHDYLVNMLQAIAETLLFFNPFVWWVGRSVRAEREHACDDMVLAYNQSPELYAHALATAEAWRADHYRLTMAFGGSTGSVLQRVRRVLGQADQRTVPVKAIWGGLVLLIVFSSALIMPPLQAENKAPSLKGVELSVHNAEKTSEPDLATDYFPTKDQDEICVKATVGRKPSQKAAAHTSPSHSNRDTLPEPTDQNAQLLRQEIRKLERDMREQELEWRKQQLVMEQQMREQTAEVQRKLQEQELAMSQLGKEAEQAKAKMEQKVSELELQKLELEKERLGLEQLQEDLQQSKETAKDEAYIEKLEKTQAVMRSIADKERALRKKEMALEKQMHNLAFEMEVSKQPLLQQQIEQREKLQQLSGNLEAQKMRLEQQMELERAKMELKMEKARAKYEQLMQRRENMREEGERMRERQQRSEGGQ